MTRRFFLAVVALLGLVSALSGFKPLYLLLFTFVTAVAVSYAWSKLQATGLDFHISAQDDYPQAGEPLRLKLDLDERLGLQRWALRVTAAEEGTASATFDLKAGYSVAVTTTIAGVPRGFNVVGPVMLESSDPLGLTNLTREIGSRTRVLVYPRTLPLSTPNSAGLGIYSESAGSTRPLRGVTAASRVREYVTGDALAHIHWPLSAKLDRMMIRELDDGGLGDEVLVVLDLSRESQAGRGDQGTEEYGVTIAASLISTLLEQEVPVGLLASGDTLYQINPDSGDEQRALMMEALALVHATGRTPLMDLLRERAEMISAGTHVLLVASGQGDAQSTALDEIERVGATVVPLFLDARSFGSFSAGEPPYELAAAYGGAVVALGDDLAYAMEGALGNVAGMPRGEMDR